MPKRERPSLVDFLKNFEEQKKKKEAGDENKPSEQVSSEKEKPNTQEQTKTQEESKTQEQLFKEKMVVVPKVVVVPKPTISEINDKTRKTLKLDELASKYNSHIKNNFFKITIKLENYNFEFVPTKLYLLIDTTNYVACNYNLKMTNNKTSEVTESNIPYYISNGKTNQLRANLLFPFMCFNEEVTKDVCPYTHSGNLSQGGLIKYELVNTLNTNKIANSINSKLESNYLDTLKKTSLSETISILSVLGRINNLLDFLICINNNNIINYDEKNIMKYHPIIENDNDELDMSKREDLALYSYLFDKYKTYLLQILQKYIINIRKLDFFKFELVDISIDKENIITKPFFNKYKNVPNICKNHRVNEESIKNINDYGKISLQLGIEIEQNLKNKMTKYTESNKAFGLPPDNIIFIKEFIELFEDPLILKDRLLENQILRWRARCYKKYLKYKTKYIQLKNKII
jgi:hypothetical protein